MTNRVAVLAVIGLVSTLSCAPPAAPPALQPEQAKSAGRPSQALRIVIRAEPGSIAGTILLATGITTAIIGGLFTGGLGNDRFTPFNIDNIPRPENRWQGTNRGAWRSPDYDRAWQAWKTALEPAQRVQQIVRMEQLINADVAIIIHYFTDVVTAHSSLLKGVVARMSPDTPAQIFRVETWEWTS